MISIKNKNLWKFSSIPGIEESTFNKVLENANLERLGFNNPSLISESYNYCGICFEYAIDEYESLKTLLSCMDIELSERVIVQ